MSRDDERSGLLGGIPVTDRSQALWGGGIAATIDPRSPAGTE